MIRKAIFETNSSSSHSFSMGPEGRLAKELTITDDNKIIVESGIWEYDHKKTNSADIKLSYLIDYCYSIFKNPDSAINAIKKVVLDFTGADDMIVDKELTCVDHQSLNIIDSRDIVNPEFIKEFIFNPGTWLYTTWDSDDLSIDFFEGNKTLFYTIVLELPCDIYKEGKDKIKVEIPIYYEENAYDLDDKLYNELYNYKYYKKTKLFVDKEVIDDDRNLCSYQGEFSWGETRKNIEITVMPKIIFNDTRKRN